MGQRQVRACGIWLAVGVWLLVPPAPPAAADETTVTTPGGLTIFTYGENAVVEVVREDGSVVWSQEVVGAALAHANVPAGTYTVRSASLIVVHPGAPPPQQEEDEGEADGSGAALITPSPCSSDGFKVIPVPFFGTPNLPHPTYAGRRVRLKAAICGPPGEGYTYQWDVLGDGTLLVPAAPAPVTASRAIEASVVFPSAPLGTIFQSRLTVWDGVAQETGVYPVIVLDDTLDVLVNVAVDEGLWYLHKAMIRETVNGVVTGRYPVSTPHTGDPAVGYVAAALEAFEENRHLLSGNPDQDPYVETVERGINFLLSETRAIKITTNLPAECPAGNPDTEPNGIGLYSVRSGNVGPLYDTSLALVAIARCGDPGRIVPTLGRSFAAIDGTNYVDGRLLRDIAQDMVDYLAWAQNESGRGGWRYGPNYGSSDNSVTQWPALALNLIEHAEGFHVTVPPFVRAELRRWLLGDSYCGGCFNYVAGSDRCKVPMSAAALLSMAWLEVGPDDPQLGARFTSALNCAGGNSLWCTPTCDPCTWNTGWNNNVILRNFGNYYAMYTVMKAARLAYRGEIEQIGTHRWYREYARWLTARSASDPNVPCTSRQAADGSWPSGYLTDNSNPIGTVLNTAWAVSTLRAIDCFPPVIESFTAVPNPTDENSVVTLASKAHDVNDPGRGITEYRFDFGDGSLPYVETPTGVPPGSPWTFDGAFDGRATHVFPRRDDPYVVTLTVVNDCRTPATAQAIVNVRSRDPDHPPSPIITVLAGAVASSKPGVDFETHPDRTVYFSGIRSFDLNEVDGDFISKYEWFFGCGLFGDPASSCDVSSPDDDSGCEVSRTWSTPGVYCVQLRLTDVGNSEWDPPGPLSASTTVTVEVLEPTAGFELDLDGPFHWDCPAGTVDAVPIPARLHTFGIPTGEPGARGWSFGIRSDGCTIRSASTSGTAAAPVPDGIRLPDGFERTEIVDPARNDGQQGVVSAVILSTGQDVTLPPELSPQSILMVTVDVPCPDPVDCVECGLQFVAGLQGAGQPVPLVVTHEGRTRTPWTHDLEFEVCSYVCPDVGDTHSTGLEVRPGGGPAGAYTIEGWGTDESGDPVLYTFTALRHTKEGTPIGEPIIVGPQRAGAVEVQLTDGLWRICVEVDDDPKCPDRALDAGRCVDVLIGGGQRPGDGNQDRALDISDPSWLLGFLFLGTVTTLPCGDGTATDPGNLELLDSNRDGTIDLSDVVFVLNFLFLGGPPEDLLIECARMPRCPDRCAP